MRSIIAGLVLFFVAIAPIISFADDGLKITNPETNEKKDEEAVKPPKKDEMQVVLHVLSRCGPMDEVSATLKNQWGEVPFAIGDGIIFLSATGMAYNSKLVLTVNAETNSFSVNAVMPDTTTCLIMSGKNFQPALPQSKKINIEYKPEYYVIDRN